MSLSIVHEASEGYGGVWVVRWRARTFEMGIGDVECLRAMVTEMPGLRLRGCSINERPSHGRAANCSVFILVTNQKIAEPRSMMVAVRAVLPC